MDLPLVGHHLVSWLELHAMGFMGSFMGFRFVVLVWKETVMQWLTQPSWMIVDEAGNNMPLFLLVKSCWSHIFLVWILLYAGFSLAFAWKFGGGSRAAQVLLKHPVASRYIGTTRRWRKCHRGVRRETYEMAFVHGKSVHKMDDTPYNVGPP